MGRKKHSKELKASIALDAIKGQNQQTVRLAGTTTIILLPAQGFTFESNENLELMRLIDEEFLRHPFYGSRKIRDYLNRQGFPVNRKRVQRLMRLMGIESVAPKPNTSRPRKEHKVYPYLLRILSITEPDQVWCSDITYIRMGPWICLSDGSYGLGKPLCAVLGGVCDHG